ncbi:MAG: DUF547 domain-containing protein [Bacteroidota bacterium]
MKQILTSIVFIISLSLGYSQTLETFFSKNDEFLKANVSEGKVAYNKIHKNPDQLNQLTEMMAKLSVSKSDALNYQAFYINAYNLSVIKGIVDNYPIKSPLDKPGFFDKTTYKIAGESITLNDVENLKLRGNFGDARIHFVLVCGAIGCPPLIAQAYMPERLEAQLQKQAKIALNNPEFIKVKKKKVELSEIFKWYKEDFVKNGDELDYINQFRTEKVPENAKISYYPYNWQLNGK